MLRLTRQTAPLTTVLLAAGLALLLAGAYAGRRASADTQDLTVTASFADRQAIAPNDEITLTLNRPLEPGEGRLALFIGQTDVTALCVIGQNGIRYEPPLPMPPGESAVTLYLVGPDNQWRQLARFPLRVAASTLPGVSADV